MHFPKKHLTTRDTRSRHFEVLNLIEAIRVHMQNRNLEPWSCWIWRYNKRKVVGCLLPELLLRWLGGCVFFFNLFCLLGYINNEVWKQGDGGQRKFWKWSFLSTKPCRFTWNISSWRFGSDHFRFFLWVICRFQTLIFQGVFNLEPGKKPSYFPLYRLFKKNPYPWFMKQSPYSRVSFFIPNKSPKQRPKWLIWRPKFCWLRLSRPPIGWHSLQIDHILCRKPAEHCIFFFWDKNMTAVFWKISKGQG